MTDATGPAALAPAKPVASRRGHVGIFVLVWLLVMAATWRPERLVAAGMLVPDSVEYAESARDLARGELPSLLIDGHSFPSRYPPGFAAILAPAYWIDDSFAAGVWISAALWAVGCASVAVAIALRGGRGAALLVIGALHLVPAVREAAVSLLSDAPAVGMLLVLVALRWMRPSLTTRDATLAGLALAVAVACRPLSVTFAVLFLPEVRARRFAAIAALVVPSAAVAFATLAYNARVFGDWRMNGYAFWAPIPYARTSLVFGLRYVGANIALLVRDPSVLAAAAGLGVAGTMCVVRRSHPDARRALQVVAAVLPVTLLHVIYFFYQSRLFLPFIVLGSLAGLVALALAASAVPSLRGVTGIGGVALLVVARLLGGPADEGARLLADVIDELRRTPVDARVITQLDPIRFEALVAAGTDRRWIGATRDQEYADKIVADEPIDVGGFAFDPTTEPVDPALLGRGGRWAVASTAEDDGALDELARDGRPLFADRPTIDSVPRLAERLASRFRFRLIDELPLLVELRPLAAEPGR